VWEIVQVYRVPEAARKVCEPAGTGADVKDCPRLSVDLEVGESQGEFSCKLDFRLEKPCIRGACMIAGYLF
jgi:hypothetical protein